MADQNLVNYIKDTLAAGFPEDQIKDAIKKQGWPDEDIKAAFQEAKEPKPATPSFVTAAQLGAKTETKPEVKPEAKPEVKPETKPEPKIISTELPAAKPTEARPLTIPIEKIKTEEIRPVKSTIEKVFAPKETEKPTTRPTTEKPNIKQEIKPKEIKIAGAKELLLPKIGIAILAIALLVLATYYLILSPALFIPELTK